MPAKSRHMQRRKERITEAKKNTKLARKIRHRRQWQAGGGLIAIGAGVTLLFLFQSGFF
ncbi:hypothetical protein [Salininema proteolyticum]|uniref:Uncharacterized protein n=1 Tax=Salininema proteolyticum TaxID=1607685 RepID=A0ABV8U545_9ACTN